MGAPRFAGSDEPANSEVKTYTLSPEELEYYRQKGKIEMGGVKMTPEQAQKLEKQVDTVNLDEELKELEDKLERACKDNINLKNLLDDLQDKYNKLALDYDKAQKLQYELTRAEDQRDSLRRSLDEVEEILGEEVTKREVLERVVRLYV